jgi:PTH1 family peptidyl-tRNA hydrolase
VICDDFQLTLGTIRLRGSGSGGGQNGLANVLARLGSTAIPRLRIGIGPVAPGWKTADFVLGKFAAHEHADVAGTLQRAADAVEEWVALGIDAAMNRFN